MEIRIVIRMGMRMGIQDDHNYDEIRRVMRMVGMRRGILICMRVLIHVLFKGNLQLITTGTR